MPSYSRKKAGADSVVNSELLTTQVELSIMQLLVKKPRFTGQVILEFNFRGGDLKEIKRTEHERTKLDVRS